MAIRSDDSGASRFYFAEDDPERRYPGVTSIVDMLPKKFLPRWSANMAADLALDSIDFVERMAERDRAGAKKYLAGAATRYTNHRASIGSKAHDLFERMIRGQALRRVHADLVPYQRQFAEFLDVVRPELVRAEDVAWSDTHAYGGSFDAWLRLRVIVQPNGSWLLCPDHPDATTVDVIADWKTSKSVWPSVAIQMGAYANADFIVSPDGTFASMPDFDGAVVLHITPEGWNLLPVYRAELEAAFGVFLDLRRIFEWERIGQRKALGKSLARSGDEFVTGTERRG
jgi:hypothetical protein